MIGRAVSLILAAAFAQGAWAATIVVAAADSGEAARRTASIVCDGEGDQAEINGAINRLPEAGGTVLLLAGTYAIKRIEGELGGVLIKRSNVTLAGEGPGTKLVLAAKQDTNVIRILGSGVGNIVIRDLYVDANRDENTEGAGDPDVSHGRFEFCGIKAFCGRPGDGCAEPTHDITIRNCTVRDAHRLGIMLEGPNMKVIDNTLGNAGSDVVEILTGPGQITGNYVEITGQTHVAIGSDRGDSIVMADNVVRVKPGGSLDIAFRSWANSQRHVIADNVVIVEPEGRCGIAVDARGYGASITGNVFEGLPDATEPMRLVIGGGDSILQGNVLRNVAVEINDPSETPAPIVIGPNVHTNAPVDIKAGKVERIGGE